MGCGHIIVIMDRPGRGNLLAGIRPAAICSAIWSIFCIRAYSCHLYTYTHLVVQFDVAGRRVYLRMCVGSDVLEIRINPAGIDQSRGLGCAGFCGVAVELKSL